MLILASFLLFFLKKLAKLCPALYLIQTSSQKAARLTVWFYSTNDKIFLR